MLDCFHLLEHAVGGYSGQRRPNKAQSLEAHWYNFKARGAWNMPKRSSNLSQFNHTHRKERWKKKFKQRQKTAVSYLADGVRGGVVVAWWFAANPFAMFSLGGVTTLGDTNQIISHQFTNFIILSSNQWSSLYMTLTFLLLSCCNSSICRSLSGSSSSDWRKRRIKQKKQNTISKTCSGCLSLATCWITSPHV